MIYIFTASNWHFSSFVSDSPFTRMRSTRAHTHTQIIIIITIMIMIMIISRYEVFLGFCLTPSKLTNEVVFTLKQTYARAGKHERSRRFSQRPKGLTQNPPISCEQLSWLSWVTNSSRLAMRGSPGIPMKNQVVHGRGSMCADLDFRPRRRYRAGLEYYSARRTAVRRTA